MENDTTEKKKVLKDVNVKSLEMAAETLLEDVQKLSPSKHALKIKYYTCKMNEGVKQKFPFHKGSVSDEALELDHRGPTGPGPRIGIEWHTQLQTYLSNSSSSNHSNYFQDVLNKIKEKYESFEFIRGELRLCGYMVNKKITLDISFWSGKADAIGIYNGNYVIVDWKVVELLNFWAKNRDAYGLYLHQCLVYARLLQLHLNLDQLPYIMIVPIDNVGGELIHPRLFVNYPNECKDEFEKYTWSLEKPCSHVVPNSLINQNYTDTGIVGEGVRIRDLFKEDVTVDELRVALGLLKFMVEENDESEN